MNRCQAGCTWTGTNRCHCSGCHQTFSTIGNFDAHHKGNQCLAPNELGLEKSESGVWVRPGDFDGSVFSGEGGEG